MRNKRKFSIREFFSQFFKMLSTLILLGMFGVFFAWIILNWLMGCCEGGYCFPDGIYPQCKPDQYHQRLMDEYNNSK